MRAIISTTNARTGMLELEWKYQNLSKWNSNVGMSTNLIKRLLSVRTGMLELEWKYQNLSKWNSNVGMSTNLIKRLLSVRTERPASYWRQNWGLGHLASKPLK